MLLWKQCKTFIFFVSYIKLPIFTIYIKLSSQFIYLLVTLKENIKRKLSHTAGIQFLNKYIVLELSLILLVKLFLENIELSIVSFQVYHYSRGNLRNWKNWCKILKEKWKLFWVYLIVLKCQNALHNVIFSCKNSFLFHKITSLNDAIYLCNKISVSASIQFNYTKFDIIIKVNVYIIISLVLANQCR